MRTKVLPLEFWMQSDWMLKDELEGGRLTATQSQFNRPGIYLEGDRCWFELGDQRSFEYPATDFRSHLDQQNAMRLNERQAAALNEMASQKMATRDQLRLLRNYRSAMNVRNTYRMSRKNMLRIISR